MTNDFQLESWRLRSTIMANFFLLRVPLSLKISLLSYPPKQPVHLILVQRPPSASYPPDQPDQITIR